jgi:acetyl-CoA acetyltransferase
MWAQRHMHEFGTTQEQLGSVVMTCRSHALLNPRAVWQKPITMDDYMESRWVARPFKLLDCDYPVDGAVALVLSRDDVAGETRKPVYIESIGHAGGPVTSWAAWPDMTRMASVESAHQLWAGTSLNPADIQVAQLYDGFSWLALCWLEDLGFVEKGEGGAFFEEGHGLLGGRLPVCTDGGQLGGGRLHGFGKVAETVRQLRHEAGQAQVTSAAAGVATAGAMTGCAAMLLTSEPLS